MIVHHGGVQGDVSTARLPADAYPALFAYSLNRKLRYRYEGNYFDFIDKDGTGSYPNRTPSLEGVVPKIQINNGNELYVYFAEGHGYTTFTTLSGAPNGMTLDGTDLTVGGTVLQNIMDAIDSFGDPKITYEVGDGVYSWSNVPQALFGSKTYNIPDFVYTRVTRIYDQKIRHGVPVQDAVQSDHSLQPRLGYSDNPAGQKEYKAIFNNKEYFDVPNLAPFIGQNFTITAIGDGNDVPRPMIGVWGNNDIITYEPSDLTTRFVFNGNMGSIIQQDGKVTQCFSGYDWTQNYTNVMSVKTKDEKAHRTRGDISPNFTNLSIGRQNQRLYVGEFSEAVMHLDELTSLGSDQLFSTTRTQYGY